jgi:cation:H+ antiporter
LAITIILSTIPIKKSFYKTDWPVMIVASLMLYGFIAFDGVLEQYEGIIMFSMLIVFLIYLLRFQKTPAVDEISEYNGELPLYKDVLYMTLGGVALWGGSELIIDGAVGMAEFYHVSERIIGVTVVSIGTSVPELAASVVAIMKKEKAISLGNLIGSNVFNILAVLGLTAIITPVSVTDQALITNDILWMLAVSFLIFPLVFAPARMKLSWKEGLVLAIFYAGFMIKAFN